MWSISRMTHKCQNIRWQPPRRLAARVLHRMLRIAESCFCMRPLGDYRSRGVFDRIVQRRNLTRAAATEIQRSNICAKLRPGRCSCSWGGHEGWTLGFATALSIFAEPRAVYYVVTTVGPRAGAAPMNVPLGNDGSCFWMHQRQSKGFRSFCGLRNMPIQDGQTR